MINYNNLLKLNPFGLKKQKKNSLFFLAQKKLSIFHHKNSNEYKKITDFKFSQFKKTKKLEMLPFLHSKIFKTHNLKSTNNNLKVFNSSGTSNSKLSKINIDFKTSLIQANVLKKIIFEFIPKNIDTIIIVDNEKSFYDLKNFDAKKAAIRGFSQYFKNKYFILNKDYKLNFSYLKKLERKLENKRAIFFGFTNVIWGNLIEKLKINNSKLDFNNCVLVHGGGWKKLENKKIKKQKLNKEIKYSLKIKNVINYYGMIEQTGSIFMECEHGYFHSSIFSDVLIRNSNFKLEKNNKPGIIQVFSLLPISYPGHNIVTEDLGVIIDEDNCKCGRNGKYFKVLGRIKDSEIKGCANV